LGVYARCVFVFYFLIDDRLTEFFIIIHHASNSVQVADLV